MMLRSMFDRIGRGAAVSAVIALCLMSSQTAQAVPPRVTGAFYVDSGQVQHGPNDWIVDGSALAEITLTFDQQVTVPAGAVTARLNPQIDAGMFPNCNTQ